MWENIYYRRKRRLKVVPPITVGIIVNRKKLEKDFSILEETDKEITAIIGPLLLVFVPHKKNLFKIIKVN